MICMEVGGVRILFKVVLPTLAISLWLLMCYPVCQKAEGFDFFLYWILVVFPFGIRKMCLILIPKNFEIAGNMGVLALNGIIGGLIGEFALIGVIVRIMGNLADIQTKK